MQRVLATKLFLPPPTATFVARQRLLDRLRDVLRHPLTVVITPAGYGKTTLVSTWAANAVADGAASVAWLTLDPHDDDPARFWTAVIAALQTSDLSGAEAAFELALQRTTTGAYRPPLAGWALIGLGTGCTDH